MQFHEYRTIIATCSVITNKLELVQKILTKNILFPKIDFTLSIPSFIKIFISQDKNFIPSRRYDQHIKMRKNLSKSEKRLYEINDMLKFWREVVKKNLMKIRII